MSEASSWAEIAATLTAIAPVVVECEPDGGNKLCIVSVGSSRLIAKIPGNRKADRALAEAIAAAINVTARASVREAA